MSSSVAIAAAVAAIVFVAGLIALVLIPSTKGRRAPRVLRPLLRRGRAVAEWAFEIPWTVILFFRRLVRAVAPRSRREEPVIFPIVPNSEAVREGVGASADQRPTQESVVARVEGYGVPRVSAEAVESESSATSAAQPAEPPPTSPTESLAPEPAPVPIAANGAVTQPGGWNDELVTLIERTKECRHALSLLLLQLDPGSGPPEASAFVDAMPEQIAAGYGRAEARVWRDEPNMVFVALPGVVPKRAIALSESLSHPFADVSSPGWDSIVAFGVAGFPRDARSAGDLVAAARRSLDRGAAADLNLSRAGAVPEERKAPAVRKGRA